MLVKDKNSSELYIHICPDAHKYTRKALFVIKYKTNFADLTARW